MCGVGAEDDTILYLRLISWFGGGLVCDFQ